MNDWGLIVFLLVIAMIWSLIWKGIALWKSARHGQTAWFVVLLILNTVGLLEIIYLAFFQKRPPVQKFARPAPAMQKRPVRRKK
ncbi:MAG: DUF5652 family protein [Candidatus Nanoarchaeia archaeon]